MQTTTGALAGVLAVLMLTTAVTIGLFAGALGDGRREASVAAPVAAQAAPAPIQPGPARPAPAVQPPVGAAAPPLAVPTAVPTQPAVALATRPQVPVATPPAAGPAQAASVPTQAPPTATPVPAKPTPAPTVAAGQVVHRGEAVTGNNWEYTVTNVETTKTLAWSEVGNTTDAKGLWLVVYLTLKNTGKENVPINVWDFELHAAGDVKYKSSTETAALGFVGFKKLARLGEQFPPGVATGTAVVFDVAPDAADLKLWLVQEKRYIALA
ncbi:MAG TPA: DUF4352 domain-containing protein [Chloroflexota bacterium]|nr:DUF4352 domain-containing protein [Chloroflexota bacterium]